MVFVKQPAGPLDLCELNLPADSAHIPPSSPAGRYSRLFREMEEAKDAVLIAQVPTSITVNAAAAAAKASVAYDGAPQFVPISGTTMMYATNTAQKVIQVGDLYVSVPARNLVHVHHSPGTVADSNNRSASDLHDSAEFAGLQRHVRDASFVSDGNVQASYTAGYMGAFIVGAAVGAVVAGDTGYYYPPYYYHPAYGYPTTITHIPRRMATLPRTTRPLALTGFPKPHTVRTGDRQLEVPHTQSLHRHSDSHRIRQHRVRPRVRWHGSQPLHGSGCCD